MTDLEKRLARALERRFGRSVMPYSFRSTNAGWMRPEIIRCTDTETGSWIEGCIRTGTSIFHVVAEHDGA